MSSANTIAKNTGFLLSVEVVDKALSFFLIALITRYLGNIEFGKYSFAFSFLSLFLIMSNPGAVIYLFREVAKDKTQSKNLFGNVVALRGIITIIVFLFAAAIIRYWPKAREIAFALFLVEIILFFDVFAVIMKFLFNAYEKNKYTLYLTAIDKVLSLIVAGAALARGYGLSGVLASLIFAKIITVLLGAAIIHKHFFQLSFFPDFRMWGLLFKNSLSFWFTMIFQRVYTRIDVVMLSALKDFAVTGWYSAAATLMAALTFIPGVIVGATFPAMSYFHHTHKNAHFSLLYHKTFSYMLMIAIPASIGLALLPGRIIIFIYKQQFIEAGAVLQILSFSLLFLFPNYIMGYLLNAINKQHAFTVTTGVSTAANVLLNLALIPLFSYKGAAYAALISQAINFLMLLFYTKKSGFSVSIVKLTAKPLAAGLLMGAFVYFFGFLPVITLLPLAALLYFGALFMLGALEKDEILLIKSFFAKHR